MNFGKYIRKTTVILSFMFSLFFISDIISAQTLPHSQINKLYIDYMIEKHRNPEYFESISGTPYANIVFSDGLVYIEGNEIPVKAKMRYNNWIDEMEFLRETPDTILLLENKQEIDSILLNNHIWKYLGYIKKDKIGKGYFKVLYNGACNLYEMQRKEFQPERKPQVGYETYKAAEFNTLPAEYYVQFRNGPLIYLPNSKRKLLNVFRDEGYKVNWNKKIKYNPEFIIPFVQTVCANK
mgnify:CR=1 FL=1